MRAGPKSEKTGPAVPAPTLNHRSVTAGGGRDYGGALSDGHRIPGRLRLGLATLGALVAVLVCTAVAAAAPPAGVTANALDGRVDLAWQPAAGATAYNVYRGAAAGSITSRVSPAGGVSATS